MTVSLPQRARATLARLGLATGIALLAACSSTPKDDYSGDDAQRIYAEAKADLGNGAWDRAIKGLERVEARAGGTLLAQQAQLDLAYAQWKSGERATALATLDRFIKNNPSSNGLDYALYLKGLVNFNDSVGWLGELAGQDPSERDQRASRDAHQAFQQLLEQFPQSSYAEDARLRINYIINSLAEYELHVARYYFRRGAYVASASRAQQVITEFPQTPANEEALYIMVRAYEQLNLPQLRNDAQRVLEKNFPNSRFLLSGRASGLTERPWWRLW